MRGGGLHYGVLRGGEFINRGVHGVQVRLSIRAQGLANGAMGLADDLAVLFDDWLRLVIALVEQVDLILGQFKSLGNRGTIPEADELFADYACGSGCAWRAETARTMGHGAGSKATVMPPCGRRVAKATGTAFGARTLWLGEEWSRGDDQGEAQAGRDRSKGCGLQ